ncbi:MAG: DUF1214 domain-containing protein [Planctomycetota bacterium]
MKTRRCTARHQGRQDLAAEKIGMEFWKNEEDQWVAYFGTKAPEGKEANWLPTKAGKRFFPMFRFYGPQPAALDTPDTARSPAQMPASPPRLLPSLTCAQKKTPYWALNPYRTSLYPSPRPRSNPILPSFVPARAAWHSARA